MKPKVEIHLLTKAEILSNLIHELAPVKLGVHALAEYLKSRGDPEILEFSNDLLHRFENVLEMMKAAERQADRDT